MNREKKKVFLMRKYNKRGMRPRLEGKEMCVQLRIMDQVIKK